jgi:hypothetical protein
VFSELPNSVQLDAHPCGSWMMINNADTPEAEEKFIKEGWFFSAGAAIEASAFGCGSNVVCLGLRAHSQEPNQAGSKENQGRARKEASKEMTNNSERETINRARRGSWESSAAMPSPRETFAHEEVCATMPQLEERREYGLDNTLSETFPCSDPLSSIPNPT